MENCWPGYHIVGIPPRYDAHILKPDPEAIMTVAFHRTSISVIAALPSYRYLPAILSSALRGDAAIGAGLDEGARARSGAAGGTLSYPHKMS